jgi:hypothetical protein
MDLPALEGVGVRDPEPPRLEGGAQTRGITTVRATYRVPAAVLGWTLDAVVCRKLGHTAKTLFRRPATAMPDGETAG